MTSSMWILLCFVSSTVLISSAGAVCPYNVTTCKCTGRSLICSNLSNIPALVSDNKDGNITDLTFIASTLNISNNSLPSNLTNLVFSNVNITSISPDAFTGSATTLKSLSLSKVEYPESPDALSKVGRLEDLKVYDTNITNWKTEVFQNVGKTLRSVVFQNVNLSSWPGWLEGFTLVNSVDLSRNSFNNISVGAFSKVQNLTNLYLVSTGLGNETNLDAALNPVINTLQILNIRDNSFGFIPQVISNMTKLTELDISMNVITEITSDKIPQQLKELDLYKNVYLTQLKNASFPNASSLEVLNLDATLINSISLLAFEPLQKLRELYLNASSLTQIPLALTTLTTKLEVLNLGNKLTCPCPQDERLFNWYKSYNKTLDLSGNCNNNKYSIKDYLTSPSACSGTSRATFNVVLYFFVLAVMGVFLL